MNGIPLVRPGLAIAAGLLLFAHANGQTFGILHTFTNSPDGANPYASLAFANGALYGTAQNGGSDGNGMVYSENTNGSGLVVLHNFASGALNGTLIFTNSDGAGPREVLVSGQSLFGAAPKGGEYGSGTIFAMDTAGMDFNILHAFAPSSQVLGGGANDDGISPKGLLLSDDGILYGTTTYGGTNGGGTVFALATNNGSLLTLHSFSALYNNTNGDGADPWGGLILTGTNLYGTTTLGGSNGDGTIFEMATNGDGFVVLHTFIGSDGSAPRAALVLAGDTLYGTTSGGGASGHGTVFCINTDGTCFTNLYNFTGGIDGADPWAPLIFRNNALLGTTVAGGANENGTVFALYIIGSRFTNLRGFTALSAPSYDGGTNADGANPYAGLIGCGSTIYGTTAYGGANGFGTMFSLPLPPPPLFIAAVGTNVILTWPTNAITYTLQSATNLLPPVSWNAVAPSPAILNGQNTVTNSASGTQIFYRLSQ